MRIGQAAASLAALSFLSACAGPLSFADPDEITLAKALDATACGLATYSNSIAAYRARPGTIVDTVEVNFAVKGTAKNNSDLILDTKFSPIGPLAALGLNYSNKNETYGERSNTIKIVMRNVQTVGLNEAGKKTLLRDVPRFNAAGQAGYYDRPCQANDRWFHGFEPDPMAENYGRLKRSAE